MEVKRQSKGTNRSLRIISAVVDGAAGVKAGF